MEKQKNITITCNDGIKLAGTLYTPEKLKGAVLIAPATGIVRQFYTSFAKHLANNGFGVITFDNRGIGGSLHGNINDSKASLVDWGQLDATAALEYLQHEFPNTSYHLVGHSAGGQLVGLMPNAHLLSSIFNFGCSSGSFSGWGQKSKLNGHIFLGTFIPLSNLIFGHTKSQWVGMGEPLPKKVASQWRKWCYGKGYVKVAFGKEITKHYYDSLEVPSYWINASDDGIATNANVDDMIAVFDKLPAKKLELHPEKYGYKDIGHMKFFSKKRNKLWSIAIDWLEEHTN